ncbi:MAG: tripartite tricarboxylate transporter substrate binding protein [Burkholderiaceae bacterium]|nr:tripartite tricarboxylate transporter substrate binding protein [Burkholderiaceae bacterium]
MRVVHSLLSAAVALVGATASIQVFSAEPFPSKPVKIVVAYAAGGGTDALVRAVGAQLSTQLGQPILVDNRPGGGAVIAAEAVAKSPPDGHTLFSADNGSLIFNTALFKKLPYNPIKDFSPIGLMARDPLVLAVNPAAGFNSAKELIEAIRKNPGKISYASPGVGGPHHIAMEMLKTHSKLDVLHVPYKGAAPAIQDVAGGQLPLMVVDTAAGMQMIKAGKLKALATFSKVRLPLLPDVPTLIELGYTEIEAVAWLGLVAPSSTPKETVDRLSIELQKAINTPSIRTTLLNMGLEPTPSDAKGMAKLWENERNYWPQLIRERNINLD